jgi:hypothetical protein
MDFSFDYKRKLVIRGVVDKCEKEGRAVYLIKLINKALRDIFSEFLGIVVYDTFDAEAGDGTFFDYDEKWSVYGVSISNTSFNRTAIRAFMDRKFRLAEKIVDIAKVQAAAESRVNKEFERSWKVYVVKLRLGSSWYANV